MQLEFAGASVAASMDTNPLGAAAAVVAVGGMVCAIVLHHVVSHSANCPLTCAACSCTLQDWVGLK